MSFLSSVGRAVDCSGIDIHRSLVQIRQGGFFFPLPFFFFLRVRNGDRLHSVQLRYQETQKLQKIAKEGGGEEVESKFKSNV